MKSVFSGGRRYRQCRLLFAKSRSIIRNCIKRYRNRLHTFASTILKHLGTSIQVEGTVEIPTTFPNTNPQYKKAKTKNTLFRCGKFEPFFRLYTFPLLIFSSKIAVFKHFRGFFSHFGPILGKITESCSFCIESFPHISALKSTTYPHLSTPKYP